MTDQSNQGYCFGLPFLLETESIEDAVELAAELRLSFVELNTNFPQSILDKLDPKVLNDLAEEYGIFFTLHLDDSLDFAAINPLVREACVETIMRAIDLCRSAEMPVINCHFAKGNIVTLPDGKHYINEAFEAEFIEHVLTLRSRCEAAIGTDPIKICIENTDKWMPHELRAIRLLLESPVFGLTLDIGHDHATGNQDLAFILDEQEHLCHMHAHDGWDQVNHQGLGSGEIPIMDRLNLARRHQATVVLETKTIEAVHQSVNWLIKHHELT